MTRLVAVDFDGVLHDYSAGWTGYEPTGDPLPGAREFIDAIIARGLEPVVHSARADCRKGVVCIEDWLYLHGFAQLRVLPKLTAIAYIDDRGVYCEPQAGFSFDMALAHLDRLTEKDLTAAR